MCWCIRRVSRVYVLQALEPTVSPIRQYRHWASVQVVGRVDAGRGHHTPFCYTGSAIESTQRPGVDAVSLAGLKKTSNVQVRGV